MRTHGPFMRGQIGMPTALCHQADSVMYTCCSGALRIGYALAI